MKSKCCQSKITKEGKQIYCSECLVELTDDERQKYIIWWKHQQRKRNRLAYYKKKGRTRGVVTIREAARLKGVKPEYVARNINKFHFSSKPLGIRYDYQFVSWNPRPRRLKRDLPNAEH